jgi:hypothetical protein
MSDQLHPYNMHALRKPMPQLLIKLAETGKAISHVPFSGFIRRHIYNVTHKFTGPSYTITTTVI